MNKVKNRANLDKTLSFTQSSYAYKDPYQPRGNPIYKVTNGVKSFFALRSIENEFADFKVYHLNRQFGDIYKDLTVAYGRSDKVTMQRSMSEAMYKHS